MAQDSIARALALKAISEGGGGSGTSDYSQLSNKPQINSVTLTGNKTLSDLGIPSYSAGSNISINNGVISATDTTYSAGENITITGTTISATVPSLEGYATESWVTSQDYLTSSALSGYATESFVTSQGYITDSALSGYATESWVTSQDYLSSSDLSGYATESFVTSQGYITSSALSGYATESWVGSQGYLTAVPSEYATKTYVDSAYTAGSNVTINAGVISATDTTYTAGSGISISNGVISATGGGGASYTAGTGIDITSDVISCTYSAGTAAQYDPTECLVTQGDMYNWDNKLNGTTYVSPGDILQGYTEFSGNGSQMGMSLEQNDMMMGEMNSHALRFTQNSSDVAKLNTSHSAVDQMTMANQNTQAEVTIKNTTNSTHYNEEHTILLKATAYAEEVDPMTMMPETVVNDTKQVTLTARSFAVDGNEIATQAYVDTAIGGAIGGSY